jgi:hypothetical protein
MPIQNVWFDDAATLAMGEAFDRASKSLGNLGSAVSEIIAYLTIKAAKTGERDPARLYEQVLNAFGAESYLKLIRRAGANIQSHVGKRGSDLWRAIRQSGALRWK